MLALRSSKNPSARKARRARRMRPNALVGTAVTPVAIGQRNTSIRVIRQGFTNISSQAVLETVGSLNFALSYLPNYTEFTSLFDQYRILRIDASFLPIVTSITAKGSWSPAAIVTVLDYDDSNSPTNSLELIQYETSVISPITARFTRTFIPRVSNAVYNNGVTTGYSLAPAKTWIDCGSPSVQHFGIKYAVLPTGDIQQWQIVVKYHLEFRAPR